jgi:hypothetical protein
MPLPVSFNRHYYELRTETLNRDDAAAFAATLTFRGVTGHLVTINRADEQKFAAILASGTPVWTDVNDISNEGSFVYSSGAESGSALTYTAAWGAGQPSNTNNGDCVQLSADGSWTAEPCTDTKAFLVEFECPAGEMFGATACESLFP